MASPSPAPNAPDAQKLAPARPATTLAAQRAALRELRTEVARAAAERQRIDQQLADARSAALTTRNRVLAHAESVRAEQVNLAHSTAQAALQAAATVLDDTRRRAESQRARDREVARERGQRDLESSKQQRNEAVWFAETCLDTERTKIRALRQADQVELAGHAARLTELRRDADAVLERWRQGLALKPATVPHNGEDASASFDQSLERVRTRLDSMARFKVPALIAGPVPWVIVFALAGAGAVASLAARAWKVDAWTGGGLVAGALIGAAVIAWAFGAARARARSEVVPIATDFGTAQGAYEAIASQMEAADKQRTTQAKEKFESEAGKARAKHEVTAAKVQERVSEIAQRIDEAFAAAHSAADAAHAQAEREAESQREQSLRAANDQHERETAGAHRAYADSIATAEQIYAADWAVLNAAWIESMNRISTLLTQCERAVAASRTDWSALANGDSPPAAFTPTVEAATALVDVCELTAPLEGDVRLRHPMPDQLELAVPLQIPDAASLLLLCGPDAREQSTSLLSAAMLRILTTLPPGKARFTIIDPVGLGQSFAGFMRLSEFATTGGSLVGERIWTEARHIEQKLADVTEHMETVIQKYLRNQYESIDQYNAAAGEVAEPYRFVVIADFPVNISEIAAKRLESILASGPRCGVYVLCAATRKDNLPQGIKWQDLSRACTVLSWKQGKWTWEDPDFQSLPIRAPGLPSAGATSTILDSIGKAAMEASRVRVPFGAVAPNEQSLWTRSSADGINVPLGRAGATKLQHMALGQGTQQHVLIAGRTGSGKSTLLHVIITAAAMWYSPDEVELYLVDFKKGVEFKSYATFGLPHARVIAVESEREFGLSVLRRLDAELTRRGDLFRRAGSQSLASYRNTADSQVMPRVLLVVDEFQEFFIEDDKLAQEAGLLMDRLVRQGRAFGMHVILGSQTLAGAYSLARSTIGQMGVRVALQCSEADSYLILADDNPAARLLNRPGEAIYNDASGMLEGNNPFQVCWLEEDDRAQRVASLARAASSWSRRLDQAIVFEGNAPAAAETDPELASLICKPGSTRPSSYKFQLGSPISIKEPTGALLRRRSASNLLIVGQSEEQALGMLAVGISGLILQDGGVPSPQAARVVLLDGTPADTPLAGVLPAVARSGGPRIEPVEYRAVPAAIATLHGTLQQRLADEAGATGEHAVFLIIVGLQRFRVLARAEDDFSFGTDDTPKPDKLLASIIREGPAVGIHTVVWCDSAASLDRFVKRQSLSEFDARVLLQMSVNDSSNLIDSPAAGSLGRDRALLFSEERGTVERFRPFAVPPETWMERVQASTRTGGSPASASANV